MPYISHHRSPDGRLVRPSDVERGSDLYCPECGGKMGIRGGGETDKKRHFWHIENLGDSEGNECSGAGNEIAESKTHQNLKSVAVDALANRFDGYGIERIGTEIPIDVTESCGETNFRRADALVQFVDKNRFFGHGVMVEVQYRNDGKNRPRVSADAIASGYSILWIDETDFSAGNASLTEIDTLLNSEKVDTFTPYKWTEADVLAEYTAADWFSLDDGWTFSDPEPDCQHEFEDHRTQNICALCATMYRWHEPSQRPIFQATSGFKFETRVQGEQPNLKDGERPHVHNWFTEASEHVADHPHERQGSTRERCFGGECSAVKVTDSQGTSIITYEVDDVTNVKTRLMGQQERCEHEWRRTGSGKVCWKCDMPKNQADGEFSGEFGL